MISSLCKLILFILIAIVLLFVQINGKIEGVLKKVKCFECNSTHNDCNYLEYINNNHKYIIKCEDDINNDPQCYVAVPLKENFPKPARGCKEQDYKCPENYRCCFCVKNGCNANDQCTGSSANRLWQLFLQIYIKSLLIMAILGILWASYDF